MKKVLLIVFLLLSISLFCENLTVDSSLGSFSVKVNEPSNTSSETKTTNLVDELATRVELIETKYKTKLNKLDQKRIQKVIDEMYELLALLPEDLVLESSVPETNNSATYSESSSTSQSTSQSTSNSTSNSNSNVNINIITNDVSSQVTEAPDVVAVVEEHKAMDSSAFSSLLSSLKNESFADDKVRVIKLASRKGYFNVNQIKTVLNEFSFADDKIEAVSLLYPKVVDDENAHLILDSFTFSSDKDEVEQIISN